jgi:aspartate-semialdehyde dehydrogenase
MNATEAAVISSRRTGTSAAIRRVGLVGWRGMVGSVLMQRMREERDFDHIDPVFFTTSQPGANGPDIGKEVPPLRNAADLKELKSMQVIVSPGRRIH